MPYPQIQRPGYAPPQSGLGATAMGLLTMGERLRDMALQNKEQQRIQALDQRAVDWRSQDIAFRNARAGKEDERYENELTLQYGASDEPPPVQQKPDPFGVNLAMAGPGLPTLGERIGQVAQNAPTINVGGKTLYIDPSRSVPGMQATAARGQQVEDANTAFAREQELIRLRETLARERPQAPNPVNWSTITTDQGIIQVNPETGETRPVQVGGQPAQPRTNTPTTSDQRRAADALLSLEALAANPSPSGDLAFKTLFMKVLDPQSVVREGELKMLNEAGSLWDKFGARRAEAETGMLTPERRADMLQQARAVLQSRDGDPAATDGAPTRENALRQRASQLKAEGKSEQEARAILQREGLL